MCEMFIQRIIDYAAHTVLIYIIALMMHFFHYFSDDEYITQDEPWYHKTIQQALRATNHVFNDMADRIDSMTPQWGQKNKFRIGHHRGKSKARGTTARLICMAAIIAMTTYPSNIQSVAESGPFDTDSQIIGIDNRASACISNEKTDFIGKVTRIHRIVKGFGGRREMAVWMGTIKWNWEDDQGVVHEFIIPKSYYIPAGSCRLLSPQHWSQQRSGADKRWGAGETTNGISTTLYWDKQQFKRTIPIDRQRSNVASFSLAPGYTDYQRYCEEAEIPLCEECEEEPLTIDDIDVTIEDTQVVTDDEESVAPAEFPKTNENGSVEWYEEAQVPFNLDLNKETYSDPHPTIIIDEEDRQGETVQSELLRMHYKFGHMPFSKLQELAKRNIIPKRMAKCHVPVCSACHHAKITRRAWRPRTSKNKQKKKNLKPGDVVSVDQMVSPTPGLIAQMTGFITKERYRYATIYVDHASGLSYVYLQKTSTADETLRGKLAFEHYSRDKGVTIKAYHADNGIFKAKKWIEACRTMNQSLTFAAVGAHHQNGKAERRIREIQETARASLIHANRRWPIAITANLWPYAVRTANECINAMPNMQDPQRRSPIQLYSDTEVDINHKHFIPFGCPVYVLDSVLQAGKPHHKWKERSTIGIYLGQSPIHNRNVALVLNRYTGLVSPQFHVKMDTGFYTIQQQTLDSQWQVKTHFVREQRKAKRKAATTTSPEGAREEKRTHSEQERMTSEQEGASRQEGATKEHDEESKKPHTGDGDSVSGSNSIHEVETRKQNEMQMPTGKGNLDYERRLESQQRIDPNGSAKSLDTNAHVETHHHSTEIRSGPRRSGRTRKPVERLIEVMEAEIYDNTKSAEGIEGELFCYEALFGQTAQEYQNSDPLHVYKAAHTDPDTMYMHEAMKQDDAKEFKKAMQKEVDDQLQNGNFSIIRRDDVPKGKIILPSVWQMKRRRDIKTRKVKKHKARLNIDGSRMRPGEHYDAAFTYAPVASWNSVRLLLALVCCKGYHTTQIDYVQAYPQAPVEREIYMEIPRGFAVTGVANQRECVLKIHRNIYGQVQAGRVWNDYLTDKLINVVGFKQSKVDECVFYKGNVIYILYTDDSILAGPSQKEIDQVIEQIQQAKLKITVEGDIKDFLGVNIEKRDNGGIKFSQPHLIDKILKETRLDGKKVKKKRTPCASSKILHRHSDSPPMEPIFNYRSVIGMLNYLDKGSRSDIAYTAHQCARFVDDPKKEHADAVKWLARYLKKTRNKGTVYHPDPKRGLEVWTDSDFSGNWNPIETADRDTARSRHGYIIFYMGCPVLWKSQLQSEIALSSTESEYTGLSYALREAIPLMELLKEWKKQGHPVGNSKAQIHGKVFEDNSGAVEMAKIHKYRPRTKHLNCKLHHFRSYVDTKQVSIHQVDTSDMVADYLTKPTPVATLKRLRKRVMGW